MGAFAASAASATSPGSPPSPETQVQRACTAAARAVEKVVRHAATAHVQTITINFQAATPGTLTGQIAFNATGSTIRVATDPPAVAESGGCGLGSVGPGVPRATVGRGSSPPYASASRTPAATR